MKGWHIKNGDEKGDAGFTPILVGGKGGANVQTWTIQNGAGNRAPFFGGPVPLYLPLYNWSFHQ